VKKKVKRDKVVPDPTNATIETKASLEELKPK